MGRCPRGEERTAISPVEKGEKAGVQRVGCARRALRDGAALPPPSPREKPCEGLGVLRRGCGAFSSTPSTTHGPAGSWHLPKFGERERSQRDAGEGAPPPQIRIGGYGGGDRMQKEDGGEIYGGEGVIPPMDVTEDGGQGGSSRGRVEVSCRGGKGIPGVQDWGPGPEGFRARMGVPRQNWGHNRAP